MRFYAINHAHAVPRDEVESILLTGRQEPSAVTLGNGVCVCLERGEGGHWTLEWMVRPEQL
jgi:hypothetical protein